VYNLVLLPPTQQQQQQQQQRERGGAPAAPDVTGYGPLAERLDAALISWKQHKHCVERLVYMFEHRWAHTGMCGVVGPGHGTTGRGLTTWQSSCCTWFSIHCLLAALFGCVWMVSLAPKPQALLRLLQLVDSGGSITTWVSCQVRHP
jgi:hypothetical protein